MSLNETETITVLLIAPRVKWNIINVIVTGNYSNLKQNHFDYIVPVYNTFILYKLLSWALGLVRDSHIAMYWDVDIRYYMITTCMSKW